MPTSSTRSAGSSQQVYAGQAYLTGDNWWGWEIGTPGNLLDVTALFGDAVPAAVWSALTEYYLARTAGIS